MPKIKLAIKKIYYIKYVILLYIIILLLLIPIFQLCQSAVPTADDFWYGGMARVAYKETGSIFKAIGAAMQRTAIAYKTWQGTYSSIFLMSMQPGIFSLKLYRIASVILLLITLICPLLLAYTLSKYYFKTKSKLLYFVAGIYSFVSLQFMPSIFEGIYWFNASWYYTFSFNLILVFFSLAIIFANTKVKGIKITCYVFMLLLCIFLGGTNYPQVVMLTVASTFLVVLLFKRNNKNKWLYVVCWVVLGLCIAVNVFAPGNRVVAKSHVNLRYTALCMIRLLTGELSGWVATYITLAVSLVSIPFLSKLMQNDNRKYLHPAIMAVATFLILLCMYAPASFAFNNSGPLRAINVRMMVMQILIYANVINGYGYYRHKNNKKLTLNPIVAIVLTIFLLCTSFTNEKIMSAWSIKAEYSIMGLEVSRFTSSMDEFFGLLEDENTKEIKVAPLPVHEMLMPHLNMFDDYGIAGFYGKKEVIYKQ